MDFSREDDVRLIELSILEVHEAYFEFISRRMEVLRKCYLSHSKINYSLELQEYCSFAQDWILRKKKLLPLYRYLKFNSLFNKSIEELTKGIEGYFYKIAYSAFFEYLSEEYPGKRQVIDLSESIKTPLPTGTVIPYKKLSYYDYSNTSNHRSSDRYDPQKSIEARDGSISGILHFLQNLKPEKRIPFWLVYLSREHPLPENDIEWLARLNKCNVSTIQSRISSAIESNKEKSFAVSSKFLGELIREKPNTITKRIQRTLEDVKSTLKKRDTP